jgi:hypothetical protein
MEKKSMSVTRRINLGISVDEQHRGLKNLDFFADHASSIRDMRYTADKISADMGTLYLRTALTNMSCPRCKGQAKRNIKNPLLEWFLKFSGRKILYCTDCDWKQIVKEGGWQWETLSTILVAFLIIFFASIYWMLRYFW